MNFLWVVRENGWEAIDDDGFGFVEGENGWVALCLEREANDISLLFPSILGGINSCYVPFWAVLFITFTPHADFLTILILI